MCVCLFDLLRFGLGHAITSTSFSRTHPHQYVGVSGAGEVAAVTMGPDFLDSLCQHRFGDDTALVGAAASSPASASASASTAPQFETERKIESLLYRRDLAAAYDLIASTTGRLWDQGQTDQVAQLLKLASSGLFAAAINAADPALDAANGDGGGSGSGSSAASSGKSFTRLVRDVSYYCPPKGVRLTEPQPAAAQRIQLFKLRIALVKLLEAGKYADILSLENEILLQIERSGASGATAAGGADGSAAAAAVAASTASSAQSAAFSVPTLLRVVSCILPHDYLRAVNFAYRLAELFAKQNRFSDLVSVSHLLMYPTIYHDTQTPTAAAALVKASSATGAAALGAAGGADGGGDAAAQGRVHF